jgi:uncharacterized protein (DUF3820 family)
MNFYIPFGKYRGKSLREVPAGYLWWISEETEIANRDPGLYWALLEELKGRLINANPSFARSFSQGMDLAGVIQMWYRTMVMECHPDRGGSCEAMKAVANGKKLLEKLLKEAGAN